MEKKKENLLDVGEFIAEYSAHMMGCGYTYLPCNT